MADVFDEIKDNNGHPHHAHSSETHKEMEQLRAKYDAQKSEEYPHP